RYDHGAERDLHRYPERGHDVALENHRLIPSRRPGLDGKGDEVRVAEADGRHDYQRQEEIGDEEPEIDRQGQSAEHSHAFLLRGWKSAMKIATTNSDAPTRMTLNALPSGHESPARENTCPTMVAN